MTVPKESRNERRATDRIGAFLSRRLALVDSPADRRQARRVLASRALDADDARSLMAALGLFDADEARD